jgi:hypothetical protein
MTTTDAQANPFPFLRLAAYLDTANRTLAELVEYIPHIKSINQTSGLHLELDDLRTLCERLALVGRWPCLKSIIGHEQKDCDIAAAAAVVTSDTVNHIVGTYEVTPEGRWVHTVEMNGMPLPIEPSQRVYHHSDAFNWGYGGSGPGQLALALLLTCTDAENAWRLHHLLKEEVVARWPHNESFTWPYAALRDWFETHRTLLDESH